MKKLAVPVDLLNPGQVFASLGLVEAIETLTGSRCESRFVVAADSGRSMFEIECSSPDASIGDVVTFLARATVEAVVVRDAALKDRLSATKWSVPDVRGEREISETPVSRTPATMPARLKDAKGRVIELDSWADGAAIGRDNVKFWAGAGGYPGAALARDAVETLSALDDADIARVAIDPFAFSAPMSSSFRFDWRRDYVPLDVGFSPNRQSAVKMTGYPLVELLAAIGIENARPARVKATDKLSYRYGAWCEMLPTSLARVCLGGIDLGFAQRSFTMQLGWPGQANQARCIISAREELVS